jgi:hypothetical protein
VERKEIMKRIIEILAKYLIRDPIFEDYTKRFIGKLFGFLRISPKILAFLYSIINYFRYYAYIA